ncbi:MAG: family 43 glycosylhydrolase [Chloroflexi bacterium]|nr:family 43 glycosylhydrolase [Chloroflexota bacterium]
MQRALRHRFFLVAVLFLAVAPIAPVAGPGAVATARGGAGTYSNPLPIQIPGDGLQESCADPSIVKGAVASDNYWYAYCTTDPLNDADRDPNGNLNFHLIPMLRSYDLTTWTYMGDAFATKPGWVAADAGLWAPDIRFFNGQYYLYYTASNTSLPGGGSAIGVATSASPLGPWVDSGAPVVEPHEAPCCAGSRRWVYDPDVIEVAGQKYIFYGSYFGGISARRLTPDGLHSDPASQTQITIANRYEGTYLVQRGDYFYLFASATNCCNGPLTGYSVFVGRSVNVLGPYLDREGASMLDGRVGGTPVISMNGNQWVGTGHNSVFTDYSGQYWFLYAAINRNDPYFASPNPQTINKRRLLMDALDWIDGWPTVRGGLWASDTPQQAPAAQPGEQTNYHLRTPQPDLPGRLIASASDEFNGSSLSPQWGWVRPPDPASYGESGGLFRFDTQNADLYVDSNNASVLTEPAPNGNYIVDAKLNLNVPPEGCCFNYVQGGLVIYGDDDNFIKLSEVSIFETRQTEFAKELFPVPSGYPRYGNTVVGPPGDWTYLRVVKSTQRGEEQYQAYTSRDGSTWERGGTWTHSLGRNSRIGLVSMGGSGFVSSFDYVRVYQLKR